MRLSMGRINLEMNRRKWKSNIRQKNGRKCSKEMQSSPISKARINRLIVIGLMNCCNFKNKSSIKAILWLAGGIPPKIQIFWDWVSRDSIRIKRMKMEREFILKSIKERWRDGLRRRLYCMKSLLRCIWILWGIVLRNGIRRFSYWWVSLLGRNHRVSVGLIIRSFLKKLWSI